MTAELLTLHDILVAWHDGVVTTVEALKMARVNDEADLVSAAQLSGVLPMPPRTDADRAHEARIDAILDSVR